MCGVARALGPEMTRRLYSCTWPRDLWPAAQFINQQYYLYHFYYLRVVVQLHPSQLLEFLI